MATNNLDFENFFSTTLSSTITASDTVIYLNSLPTPSEGYLVIEPDSTSNREIIFYTSKGANYVTCPSVATGRGVGGTTAVSHNSGSTVQRNVVAEDLREIQNGDSNTGMHTYFDESFSDYVLSGATISQATGLIASVSSGTAYINGRRLTFNAFNKTLTASKDTYFDLIETDGSLLATVSYTELASGATGSTPVSNGMHIGMVRSNASLLATIYQTGNDSLGNPLKLGNAAGVSPWQTWTPTWTNLTLGNGTQVARYAQIGKTVFVYIKVIFGSTSAMGTGPRFTLPVPENTTTYPIGANNYVGDFMIEDSGTANYTGTTLVGGSGGTGGKAYLYVKSVSGSYVVAASNITSTTPMTWTTNDFLTLAFTYEAA